MSLQTRFKTLTDGLIIKSSGSSFHNLKAAAETLCPHTFSIVFSVLVEDTCCLTLTVLVDNTEPIVHIYKRGKIVESLICQYCLIRVIYIH